MARKPETKTEEKLEKTAERRKKSILPRKTAGNPVKKQAVKSPKSDEKPPETAGKQTLKTKSSPKKKHPKATRPTKNELLEIGRRRQRVLDLKANYGASVRQIAARLQAEGFRASPATIQADLDAIIDEINAEQSLSGHRWRTLLVERLESQYFRLTSSMVQTDEKGDRRIVSDPEMENLLLRNIRETDRMVGASKAEQSKNNAAEMLAKLIGADPEELPGDEHETAD